VCSEACDIARAANRRELTGNDIVAAAKKLGFDEYVAPLTRYLETFKKLASTRPPVDAASAASTQVDNSADAAADDVVVPSTELAQLGDMPLSMFDDDE